MKALCILLVGLMMACPAQAEWEISVKNDLSEITIDLPMVDTTRPSPVLGYYLVNWQHDGTFPMHGGIAEITKYPGMTFMTGQILDSMSTAGAKIHVPNLTSGVLPNGLDRGLYLVIPEKQTDSWFAIPVMFDWLRIGVGRDETGKCWHVGSVSLPQGDSEWLDKNNQPNFWSAPSR